MRWPAGAPLPIVWLVASIAFVSGSLVALPAAGAELRRVESLGAAGVGEGRGSPRDRAVADALRSAVWQVAARELGVSDPGLLRPERVAEVERSLGDDPRAYAARYQILEDRGERAPRDPADPSALEYVVLVEVHVDAAQIRQRLRGGGVIAPSGEGPSRRTRFVLEDVTSWAEVRAIRNLLRDQGARTLPVELVRGRAVLEVASARSGRALVQAMQRTAPQGVQIELLGEESGEHGAALRLRARVARPDPPAAPAPGRSGTGFDTPEAERY